MTRFNTFFKSPSLWWSSFFLVGILFCLAACDDDNMMPDDPAVYDPTPYELQTVGFPEPDIPADNTLTLAGVELGRMLFYDRLLSNDGSQACADCHLQVDAFSDIRQFSIGVEGLAGKRQAMAVINLAWHENGFFWDGRAPRLRDQALMPIQDPLEMNETLENVIQKLGESQAYTDQFIRAFGDETVTSERISLAMEQFMFTMVSNNSKYDLFLRGEATLTDSEARGFDIFFSEYDPFGTDRGGECFHCHAGFNFSNDKFMNNGLDSEADQVDEGLFAVTGNPEDMAKFKVPTLRNIALTPPYMHDGRFETLEEVLDHYISGVEDSPTVDPLMQFNLDPGLELTEQDKTDLINFMHTLTDISFIENEAFSNPF